MLIHELAEREALQGFAEKGADTAGALESFFQEHYSTPQPHVEYMAQVVGNMVQITSGYYFSLPRDKRASFLKCLANVFKVALAMKAWETRLTAVDATKQLSGKPLFFASLAEMIQPLESIQKGLQEIDAKLPLRRVLLVEGASESNFIQTIQMNSTVMNFDFSVYVYSGKGEANNLVHYIRELNRQGVRVDLSYDSDRQAASFLEKLDRSCTIQSRFGFKSDFEGSFPAGILFAALLEYLRRYQQATIVLTQSDVESLLADRKPFIFGFEEKFGLGISKPKLGAILGETVLQNGALWDAVFKTSSQASEIAEFLRFVMFW